MTTPHIKRASLAVASAVAVFGLWLACDASKTLKSESSSAALERARMCAAGGAVLSREATGCVCPQEQTWDGTRCLVPEPVVMTPPATPPLDTEPDALTAVEPEPEPEVPADPPAPLVDPAMERYQKICKRARGVWHAQDQYCVLSQGRLFVGRVPRDVKGRLSDDLCERSPFKGRFVGGDCRCGTDQVFVPTLGGCVEPRPVASVTKWRTCESTLNQGKWDVRSDICQCPTGRVWDGNACQKTNRLSSRAICESAAYAGKWRGKKQGCDCGPGKIWLNQSCQPLKRLSPEAACKSEVNAGRWLANRNTCVCPRLTKWDAAAGACR
jgi:hypothetical protein